MTTNVHVSFPGLGFEKGFDVKPVAFEVFGFDIRWYALIICTGIILSFIYFYRHAKLKEQLLEDDILNLTLLAVPIAIVGARFLYVVTNLDNYDGFMDMINIREGGLAIYGAIIFGAATFLVYTKLKHLSTLKFLDAISPAVMLGQVIGRWGNFMNGEAFGEGFGVEKLPWRMVLENTYENGVGEPYTRTYVTHPTFLYESLWNALGFVIINIIYKKKKFDGQIFLLYVAWYGFGRGFIEILREDSLLVFGQKLMVYLGFITCAAAITAYIVLSKRENKDEVADFLGAKAVASQADDESTEVEDKAEEDVEDDKA